MSSIDLEPAAKKQKLDSAETSNCKSNTVSMFSVGFSPSFDDLLRCLSLTQFLFCLAVLDPQL